MFITDPQALSEAAADGIGARNPNVLIVNDGDSAASGINRCASVTGFTVYDEARNTSGANGAVARTSSFSLARVVTVVGGERTGPSAFVAPSRTADHSTSKMLF